MAFIDDSIEFALTDGSTLSREATIMAKFSLLDWLVCGRAGVDEPLSQKLRNFAADEGGTQAATLFGGGKAPARMAALANGAISHALDYDDTHFDHIGHLSVGIYPAAVAVGEELNSTTRAVIDAFTIGAEVAIRIGRVLGAKHYNQGFHQTATAGAFGATYAAGRLYGLTAKQLLTAIGLCSTRASGLKSQFGTMGKPYNAGIAASNGVECAKLAALGFTSSDDGIMMPQGFVATHHGEFGEDLGMLPPPAETMMFEDNKYKLHACCHGLHAMIEALSALDITPTPLASIQSLIIQTNPRWLRVCDNKAPRTGLEVKFSYLWLAGMVLRGEKTGDDRVYTDALARDAELIKFAQCVTAEGDPTLTDMQVSGEVVLKNGNVLSFSHDLSNRIPPDDLEQKLRDKAAAILGDEGKQIWGLFKGLDDLPIRAIGNIMSAN